MRKRKVWINIWITAKFDFDERLEKLEKSGTNSRTPRTQNCCRTASGWLTVRHGKTWCALGWYPPRKTKKKRKIIDRDIPSTSCNVRMREPNEFRWVIFIFRNMTRVNSFYYWCRVWEQSCSKFALVVCDNCSSSVFQTARVFYFTSPFFLYRKSKLDKTRSLTIKAFFDQNRIRWRNTHTNWSCT